MAGSADSAPLLKYLCYKNLATLASQAQDWTACVRFFSKVRRGACRRMLAWLMSAMLPAQAVTIDASDVVVWYKMGAAAYAGEHLSVARYALEHGLRVDPTHWLTTKLLIQVRLLCQLHHQIPDSPEGVQMRRCPGTGGDGQRGGGRSPG